MQEFSFIAFKNRAFNPTKKEFWRLILRKFCDFGQE